MKPDCDCGGVSGSGIRLSSLTTATLLVIAACGNGESTEGSTGVPGTDWERTEERASCDSHVPTRQPFFGELHIHTAFSSDAAIAGTLASPADAYRFAKGEELPIPPFDVEGNPDRVARLGRPLDFAAVTDHSESFGDFPPDATGTLRMCFREGAIVDDSECDPAAVWSDIQRAAEEHYDRSSVCGFTTFVAYEWTGRGRRPERPAGSLHRNVIFRNGEVPPDVLTADTAPAPEDLWSALAEQCRDAEDTCDVLAIPHNSNLSRGYMFDPLNLAGEAFTEQSARTRAGFEPLVEIMQSKGDSECRPGVGTTDELCSFEKINRTGSTFQPSDPEQEFQPLSFVRNGLKEGLQIEEAIGVNPFALGFIASTDGHTAAAGSVREPDFPIAGNFGLPDSTPAGLLTDEPPGGVEPNGGGLAVLWSEENSRDALFAAMRRRETYGTSGPRMVVRFFGGDYPEDLCDDPNFEMEGYRSGVPMGGILSSESIGQAPSFAVFARQDLGTDDFPGNALQRIQIVKGWLDSDGIAQEKVFDVAGDPDNGASVDPETCAPEGVGFASLCAVWSDPEFDVEQRALYYARVLENPSCRWHSYVCNDLGVRCQEPDTIAPEYANCCNPLYPRTIQERAWTSPIFYSPDADRR